MKPQVNTSTSKPRRIKRWLLAYVGVALVMLVWLGYSPPRSRQVETRFLGYTNDSAGKRLVAFEVVNRSSFGIYRLGDGYEEVTPGAAPMPYDFPGYIWPGMYILPSEAREIVMVRPPPITNAWRLKLLCAEQEPVPDRIVMWIRSLFGYKNKRDFIYWDGPVVQPE